MPTLVVPCQLGATARGVLPAMSHRALVRSKMRIAGYVTSGTGNVSTCPHGRAGSWPSPAGTGTIGRSALRDNALSIFNAPEDPDAEETPVRPAATDGIDDDVADATPVSRFQNVTTTTTTVRTEDKGAGGKHGPWEQLEVCETIAILPSKARALCTVPLYSALHGYMSRNANCLSHCKQVKMRAVL